MSTGTNATRARPVPVQSGVFFTVPAPLPRGRHKLSRDEVQHVQSERMLAAVTELLAARGYADFGPTDIASHAGVSLAAFYDCFENKDACVFAGYDRFIKVLLGRLMALDVSGLARPALVNAVIETYLHTLQSDLVVARAYQVEIDALGLPARKQRRDSLRLFAEYIRQLVAQHAPAEAAPEELPSSAYIGAVYAARQIASDALDESEQPDLPKLAAELEAWMSDLFRQR